MSVNLLHARVINYRTLLIERYDVTQSGRYKGVLKGVLLIKDLFQDYRNQSN